MKVILTKKFTFITNIYHTKFQFAQISRTMKKCNILNFCDFYVLKKGFLGANFPRIQTFSQIEIFMVNDSDKRIQTFSQIETLYGK